MRSVQVSKLSKQATRLNTQVPAICRNQRNLVCRAGLDKEALPNVAFQDLASIPIVTPLGDKSALSAVVDDQPVVLHLMRRFG